MDDKRMMLRHFLGAIAYRTQKALKGAPPEFAGFRAATGVRTPHQIVYHMSSVLGYDRTFFVGGEFRPLIKDNFNSEIEEFHKILDSLKTHLEQGTPFQNTTPEKMLQGPFSDAMSHAGQLAMMRRLFGSPVPPENFIMADIDGDNVGRDQVEPVSPDREWLDAEGKRQKIIL